MRPIDIELKRWAREWRTEHLDADTAKLVTLANYDLYCGPEPANDDPPVDEFGNENEWSGYPGFVTACARIHAALRYVPSTLYVEVDAGYWTETAPGETEPCYECEGTGECQAPVPEDDYAAECHTCDGSGVLAAYLEDWYKVERRELIQALVGKELAQYVGG